MFLKKKKKNPNTEEPLKKSNTKFPNQTYMNTILPGKEKNKSERRMRGRYLRRRESRVERVQVRCGRGKKESRERGRE
jgi:hypothetical protein